MQASVKVMRSYDYCHFEVALSDEVGDELTTDLRLIRVDELRKQAAILVDEAVRQYKTAKTKERDREWKESQTRDLLAKIERIQEKSQSEWSVEDAALMRAYADKSFWKDIEENDYFYEDTERDHHFSMLRKFQETRIGG